MAGAAALVWAANPQLRAAQVASILEQTASGRGSWNAELGYGVLDVASGGGECPDCPVATVAAVPAGRMAPPAAGSSPS